MITAVMHVLVSRLEERHLRLNYLRPQPLHPAHTHKHKSSSSQETMRLHQRQWSSFSHTKQSSGFGKNSVYADVG